MFNLAILTGRLTDNAELKTTNSGISVTRFTIAVDRRGKGEDKQTDFINIVAWRNTAEFITKYFNKGSMIGIEGSIQTRKYQDKNGNNRVAFEVVADNAHFIESKKDKPTETEPASFSNADPDAYIGIDDSGDLPF